MIANLASSAQKKSVCFKKERLYFFAIVKGGGVDSRPLACVRHWDPSPRLSAWKTHNRRSSSKPLATLRRFDQPGMESQTLRIDSLCSAQLTTELTTGIGSEIEPKTSRADSDDFNHCTNWLVWLTQNYDIASGTSACVATILFQECLLR